MSEVTINDLILINSPGLDDTLPVGSRFEWSDDPDETGLIDVLNGVTFQTDNEFGTIPIGSTTEIGGETFTLSSAYNSLSTYTMNAGTDDEFQQTGQTLYLTLTNEAGEELVIASPSDDFNDAGWQPGLINSIEVTSPLTDEKAINLNRDGDGNKLGDDKDVKIPCFVLGTLIDTAEGRKRVEDLKPGDLVLTRDHGYMALQWVGQRAMNESDIAAMPGFAAVILRAGALGPNTPECDTRVSPSHRVLVTGPRAEVLFGESEVLVPAGHLVGNPGIERDTGAVTYVHIMFDSHQIVLGDGLWSESFQPAQYSLDGLGAEQRDEIMALFPELNDQRGAGKFKAARMTLRLHESRLLFAA